EESRLFTPGDLVFVSRKYVIENSEQCITIAYASTIDDKNPNHEFNMTDVPICIPHCMFSVVVKRVPKEVEGFIYFGIETIEYNNVTGSSNIKMQMTVLYSSKSKRFQNYLGTSGSNIKLNNAYIISGLIKFSQTGKMVIETTDIKYIKTPNLNYNVLGNDVELITTQTLLNNVESTTYSVKSDNINVSKSSKTSSDKLDTNVEINPSYKKKKLPQPVYIDLDDDEQSDDDINELG
ncbi:22972_t:CDS:2, partial [Dentiscutata erythropus]